MNDPAVNCLLIAERPPDKPVPATQSNPFVETQRRAELSARLVLRGIGLNVGLAIVKITGGVLGNTYALIADGAESTLDVLSSSFVWAGIRVAGRPPDADHPYGHGKAEPLAALFVAAIVFSMAGWVAAGSIREIITPHEAPRWWTLLVLAGVVVTKFWMSKRLNAAGKAQDSTALDVEASHHWSDAVTSCAAFIGISIALLAGKGWEDADDWAALAACLVIGFNGFRMLMKALRDVMDTAVPATFEDELRAIALEVDGVQSLHKVRVRKSGLSYLVDLQIRVDGGMTVRKGHEIAHAVKDALIASVQHRISDVIVHVEPASD